jgi:hypothetical protein
MSQDAKPFSCFLKAKLNIGTRTQVQTDPADLPTLELGIIRPEDSVFYSLV